MKTGIIVQCRYNSTRLPGKILKKVLDKPLLQYLIERLKKTKLADSICIAYTENKSDLKIKNLIDKLNVESFVGSEHDVLSRHYHCAKKYNYKNIVRVTSDCPIIDPKIIDELIENFNIDKNLDYLTNGANENNRTFPLGMEAEIFNFESLEYSHLNSSNKYEREHVTIFIKKSHKFKKKYLKLKNNLNHLRLTLDTQEDYDLISEVIKGIYPNNNYFTMQNIVTFLKNNPQLININSMIKQVT